MGNDSEPAPSGSPHQGGSRPPAPTTLCTGYRSASTAWYNMYTCSSGAVDLAALEAEFLLQRNAALASTDAACVIHHLGGRRPPPPAAPARAGPA